MPGLVKPINSPTRNPIANVQNTSIISVENVHQTCAQNASKIVEDETIVSSVESLAIVVEDPQTHHSTVKK